MASDSEFSKSRIVAHTGCDPDKVVVVGACISPVFRRHDKPFDKELPTVLHVGTNWNKNLERVCQALVGIKCNLRVIGRLSAEQEAALQSSGIVWSNACDLSEEQLYGAYAECDVVVFASMYEGFGLPVIEGHTVGRPVVTSSITSMPEVAGGAACLVDPYDVSSIRRGVLRVIEDDAYRELLVERGYENALRYTPQQCAEGYLKIYEGLSRRGRRKDGSQCSRTAEIHWRAMGGSRAYSAATRILGVLLTTLALVVTSCSDGGDTADSRSDAVASRERARAAGATLAGLAGRWTGEWRHTSGGDEAGVLGIEWRQVGRVLRGSLTLPGMSCVDGASITAVVNGADIAFEALSSAAKVTFAGTIATDAIDGTYETTCGEAKGVWQARKA